MEVKNVPIEEGQLKIEYVSISELKPNEYNPKKMTEKEEADLERSITEFGVVDPLIINKANGREGIIIGGHQRYKIYQKLGYKEVPVIKLNIPDLKKEQELCLRLSKNTGSWDYDLLANFDETLLQSIGWSGDELDEVFGLEMSDEFDLKKEFEKAIENPKGVKEGDLWQLGEHRLYIGDAVKKESWEKVLKEERFDFLFTDPPYKLAYAKKLTKGLGTKKIKTKEGFGYKQQRSYLGVEKKGGIPEYDEWLSIANEFQNPQGTNIMIFEFWKNIIKIWQSLEKYWKIKNLIIWHTPNRHQSFGMKYQFFNKYDIAPLAGEGILNESYEEKLENYLKEKGQKLLDSYEIILYGQNNKSYWERKKGKKWAKLTDHISWEVVNQKEGTIIFGAKPIQILVPYIKILSPRNGIVVDCFGGSGSTLIACEIMKRRCRMIEIEPIYGEVIINRWEKFTKKSAIKL